MVYGLELNSVVKLETAIKRSFYCMALQAARLDGDSKWTFWLTMVCESSPLICLVMDNPTLRKTQNVIQLSTARKISWQHYKHWAYTRATLSSLAIRWVGV